MEWLKVLTHCHQAPLSLEAGVFPLFMRSTRLPILLEAKVLQHLDEFPGCDWSFSKTHTRLLRTSPGKITFFFPKLPFLRSLLLIMPPHFGSYPVVAHAGREWGRSVKQLHRTLAVAFMVHTLNIVEVIMDLIMQLGTNLFCRVALHRQAQIDAECQVQITLSL
ncbi:hypothetical protein LY622_13890 [Halomonas sp. M5N1S17]|nr:hypothetical protein [Halomonas alkalisoli]MCE9664526.1 hypothetical protein [Halomonas alkalisoli]